MFDEKTMIIIDDEGKEKEMEILFTFEDKKQYVLYMDPLDETGEVFVSSYNEEGELLDIESDEEWEVIEAVFEGFMGQLDEVQH